MFLVTTVVSLCSVVMVATLVRLACRYRPDLWFTSDTAILCAVSPALILMLTFGGVALGYRLTHGGLAGVPVAGWIGAGVVLALSIGIWIPTARRLRRARPDRTLAA